MGALVPGELVNGERSGGSRPVQPTNAPPGASLILSEQEIRVLEALSQPDRLTLSQLMRATGLDGNELRLALSGLSMKGLIVRLETVIRSYSCHLAGPLTPSLRDEGQTLDLRGTFVSIGGMNRDRCTPQYALDDIAAVTSMGYPVSDEVRVGAYGLPEV